MTRLQPRGGGQGNNAGTVLSPLSSMCIPLVFVLTLLAPLPFFVSLEPVSAWAQTPPQQQAVYVGSTACKDCHPEEYEGFMAYAKKSKSFESIEKLRKGLTPDEIERCYSCHTTGYGQPGGFVSPEKTPQLKNAGCEVCHGPGSVHVITQAAVDTKRRLTKRDCEACHISERVKAFRYKPMVHGGAH